jgi:transposase
VCNGGCPPQKPNPRSDEYLNLFYYCALSTTEIAARCGVSERAVAKALRQYDPEAYRAERARRKRENAEARRRKDAERKRTPEARAKDRERKRRERFLDLPYVAAVARALRDPEVMAVMHRAMREMKASREQRTFAMLLPPVPEIPHPVPGIAKDPIFTTPSEAAGRARFEIRASSGSLFGVPGPAVLYIREALDNFDLRQALHMAKEALLTAGFVHPNATVEYVLEQQQHATIGPNDLSYYDCLIREAREWAPAPEPPRLDEMTREEKIRVVKRWLAQSKAAERDARLWGIVGTAGTGKKGKGGGLQNVATRQKWEAVM